MPCATSRFCGGRPGEEGGHPLTRNRNGCVGCWVIFKLFFYVFRVGNGGSEEHEDIPGEEKPPASPPSVCLHPSLRPCANMKFRLQQTPSPRHRPGGASPLWRGGRRRRAALPLQTFPFPSLAASFPPLLSSPSLSAPRWPCLRGRGAAGEHRCPPGPYPVPVAVPKATSPPSPPSGEPACCGPTWAAQVRGREGGESPCVRGPRAEINWGLWEKIVLHTLSCLPRPGTGFSR